jgi:glycosyltransferase 2 family protein
MRKFILAIILLLGIIFVISRFTELQSIVETLQRGNLWFLGLALCIEIVWTINCGASFRAIYRAMGIEEQIATLSFMVSAANLANTVAPSAGVGGLAIFISEAHRRNYSPARVTVSGVLFLLFDYLGLICVLALGIIVLIRRNDLTMVVITASALLVGLASIFAFLLNLGMQSAQALGNALAKIAHAINRLVYPFIHREYLSEVRAHEFARDAAEGLMEMRGRPKSMLLPMLLALTNKTFLILILTSVFLAFKVPISVGTIIACFSIGYLFVIISPTPAGIGVVEGALTLALSSMYISLSDAAVLTLAYRGITFWIPLLFGMVSIRVLERVGIKPNSNHINST